MATGDDLSAKYSSVARDSSLLPKIREAAMLFSVAEGSLSDDDGPEALKNAKEALKIFTEVGEMTGVADTLRIVINGHFLQGQEEEGYRIAEEQLAAFREKGDRRGEASMLLSIAEVAADKLGPERRDEALSAAGEARTIFKELGDTKMEAASILAQSNVLMQRGAKTFRMNEVESSLPGAQEALEMYKSMQDRIGEAKSLHSVAVASAYLTVHDDAVRHGSEALEIWRDLGLRRMEGFELTCIGSWHISNRNPQDALDAGEAAMTIFAELGEDKGWEGVALGTVISAYLALGEKGAAGRLANDRLSRFQRKQDRKGEAAAWDAKVAVDLAKDDRVEALKTADRGLTFMREQKERTSDDKKWEAGMLHTVANIHLAEEAYGKAHQAAQAAVALLKEVGGQEEMAMILVTQSNASLAMKENRDALKQATDARNICRNSGNRRGEAIASVALAGAHCSRMDMLKAVNAATDAVQLFNSDKDKKAEAEATYLLAQVHIMGQDFQKGMASAKKSKDLFKEAGFGKDEVNMALLMAQAAFFDGLREGLPEKGGKASAAWERALAVSKDGLALARKTKDDDLLVKGLTFFAQVQVVTYSIDEAKNIIDEGISVCVRAGNELGEGYFRALLTQMYFMTDRMDSAKDPGAKAVAIFKKFQDAQGEAAVQELLKFIDPGEEEYQGPSEEMLAATVMDVALSLIGSESLAGDTPLMDAGLDSLASVEFQNTLAKEFTGVTLPSTLVFDFPTPKMITEHIYNGLRESAKKKALGR